MNLVDGENTELSTELCRDRYCNRERFRIKKNTLIMFSVSLVSHTKRADGEMREIEKGVNYQVER